jgi:hypothetical protein
MKKQKERNVEGEKGEKRETPPKKSKSWKERENANSTAHSGS